jgi:ComF family protein
MYNQGLGDFRCGPWTDGIMGSPSWLDQLRDLPRASRALAGAVLDFLYPPTCLACPAFIQAPDLFCAHCWQRMPFITQPVCERLGVPLPVDYGGPLVSVRAMADPPVFGRARSVALYDGAARDLVHQLKYADRLDLVPPMARLMARSGRPLFADNPVLVPVPMHRWRFLWRHFNQSALLAAEIGRISETEVLFHALRRVRRTRPQPGLTRSERASNLQGAFKVDGPEALFVQGRAVVLVDDVLTSGATANACARALLKAGAKSVDLLCFACVAMGA